jgi:hypothetical protein
MNVQRQHPETACCPKRMLGVGPDLHPRCLVSVHPYTRAGTLPVWLLTQKHNVQYDLRIQM